MRRFGLVRGLAAVVCTLASACEKEPPPQPASPPPPVAAVPAVAQGAPASAPLGKRPGRSGNQELPPPTPNTLRLVVVHDAELIVSERGQTTQLEKQLEKAGQKVDGAEASDSEKAYLSAYANLPEAPPNLPDGWASFETVVLVRVEPVRKIAHQGQTVGGRTHLAIVHPPSLTPAYSTVYVQRAENFSAPSIDGARLGIWVKNHLAFKKAAP